MSKKTGISKDYFPLIIAIILIAVGLLLLFQPAEMMATIIWILGIAMLVFGVIGLIAGIAKKKKGEAEVSVVMPVVMIIIGAIIMIFNQQLAAYILPLAVGAWAIVAGVMGISNGLKVQKFGSPSWKFLVIIGVVQIVVGVIILGTIFGSDGSGVGLLLGILLLVFGILNLVDWATFNTAKRKHLSESERLTIKSQ